MRLHADSDAKYCVSTRGADSTSAPLFVVSRPRLSAYLCNMAYSNFTLKMVVREFGLTEQVVDLFPADIVPITPGAWLLETLAKGRKIPLISEKVRSEMLVMPMLLELKEHNHDKFSVFSGAFLDVDSTRGLNGDGWPLPYDFMLTLTPDTVSLTGPLFTIVEAKKNEIDTALGQCAAQLIGAERYNQADGISLPSLYGCVTTGTDWKFMRLIDKTLQIDSALYFINEPARLLGIFQHIVDEFFPALVPND